LHIHFAGIPLFSREYVYGTSPPEITWQLDFTNLKRSLFWATLPPTLHPKNPIISHHFQQDFLWLPFTVYLLGSHRGAAPTGDLRVLLL